MHTAFYAKTNLNATEVLNDGLKVLHLVAGINAKNFNVLTTAW